MNSFDIDMNTGIVGYTYRIKVGAVNNVDEVVSDSIAVVLSSVPLTLSVPTSNSDGSFMDIIMYAPASDGGSSIISY